MLRNGLSIVIGTLIGGPLAIFASIVFEEYTYAVEAIAVIGAIALGILLVVVAKVSDRLIERLAGNKTGDFAEIARRVDATKTAIRNDDLGGSVEQFSLALHEWLVWYAKSTQNRWIMNAAVSVALIFGAVLGTVVLYQQNALLRVQNSSIREQIDLLAAQNERLDVATYISEAQRRSTLNAEITSVFNAIDAEAKEWADMPDVRRAGLVQAALRRMGVVSRRCEYPVARNPVILSEYTTARIWGITSVLSPYFVLETGAPSGTAQPRARLSKTATSPERSQLFIALVSANVYLAPILSRSNFSNIIVDRQQVRDVSLCGLRGDEILFRETSFVNVDFRGMLASVSMMGGVIRGGKLDLIDLFHFDGFFSVANTQICGQGVDGIFISDHSVDVEKSLDNLQFIRVMPCGGESIIRLADSLNRRLSEGRRVAINTSREDCKNCVETISTIKPFELKGNSDER